MKILRGVNLSVRRNARRVAGPFSNRSKPNKHLSDSGGNGRVGDKVSIAFPRGSDGTLACSRWKRQTTAYETFPTRIVRLGDDRGARARLVDRPSTARANVAGGCRLAACLRVFRRFLSRSRLRSEMGIGQASNHPRQRAWLLPRWWDRLERTHSLALAAATIRSDAALTDGVHLCKISIDSHSREPLPGEANPEGTRSQVCRSANAVYGKRTRLIIPLK